MIEFAANALFLFKMLLPSFSLDFSRITLLYHQSHINFHNSTCKTDGWWAAIISTSQKQVSAATLESSKHDP
ncbi:hypothetical protein C2W62_42790 [Candidatus Entotheonella serta]|nr:hypothetical protein C2W62_42790 [Candidatus Entotheonella serta]